MSQAVGWILVFETTHTLIVVHKHRVSDKNDGKRWKSRIIKMQERNNTLLSLFTVHLVSGNQVKKNATQLPGGFIQTG